MRTQTTFRLVLSALLCALTAVLSQIQIPLPPVPVSLSLFAVHLCGALLPPRWCAGAMGAYVLLGACGVPVFSGFAAGPSVLFGPTGGFLLGYVFCAALESFLLRKAGFTRRAACLCMAAGAGICCVSGCLWFMAVTGSTPARSVMVCIIPFIPGDIFKIIFASSLSLRLQKNLLSLGLSFHSS